MIESGRFFCESCERRFDAPGDCSDCEEEPLLDLQDEDVVEMLRDMDHARATQRTMTIVSVLAIPTLAIALLIWLMTNLRPRAVVLVAGLAFAVMLAAGKAMFPPRRKFPL